MCREKFTEDLLEIIAEVNVKKVKVEGEEIKLDTVLTDELKDEGWLRDVIRAIQDARKKENLSPNDKIQLVNTDKKSIIDSFFSYLEMIKSPNTHKLIFLIQKKQEKYVVEGSNTTFSIVK